MPASPDSLIAETDCLAQSLSVSKDHATILLRTANEDADMVKSLIKLTVLPTHTTMLAPSSDIRGMDPDDLGAAFDPTESARIKDFLNNFSFALQSESGAEYAYYNATPRMTVSSVVSNVMAGSQSTFAVEVISPASDKQIQRSMPVPSLVLMEETPAMYHQVVAPYIQSVVDSGSLSWIDNLITGKKEKERLLLDTPDYILNVDTKWRSHPDCHAVPKDEWKTHDPKALDDLYCLVIVKQAGLASIRDLRAAHIGMLKDVMIQCPKVIEEIYGVQKNQLRVFFHYQPQFYHLHIHITRLENEIGCQVERGHLVSDVIQNLEMDGEYYLNRVSVILRYF